MDEYDELLDIASRVRKRILNLIYRTRSPHIGSSLSAVEILVSLYFGALNVDPANPENPKRDRFLLSKGHACAALYAVLAEKGFLTDSDLAGFAVNGGTLEHHPLMDLTRGIETSSGSLGHGLSLGVGMALAARHEDAGRRVCVLLSDGELNEGAIWEAVMFAAQHKLGNLTAIVDCNGFQALGPTRNVVDLTPLAGKWAAFGWRVRDIGGHSLPALFQALEPQPGAESPCVIIAHTTKGKGVSFMEGDMLWHYRCPNDKEYALAMKELSA